ncbi:hypothetical protein Cni_G14633 [Canna indica]|uniref:MsrB domain-containing protein n=1 Tax=Canna indica TaxID=4628 RepID=A0AAQ3KCG3_9LILI|nr:hypothetical protein Cni_G14633 [Canna indica]
MAEVATSQTSRSTIGALKSERVDEEGGLVRVKIALTKKQLRQMVAALGQQGRGSSTTAAAHRLAAGPSLEQLLHALRRRRVKTGEKGQCRSQWRPRLQSIPEEVCAGCGADLNLSAAHLYPEDAHFEAGNKGTLSFSWVDDAQLSFAKEDRIKPFFETPNYWGILRKRTRLLCDACGHLLGHVYDDGPPTGAMRGHREPVLRAPRYRFKIKALNISSY